MRYRRYNNIYYICYRYYATFNGKRCFLQSKSRVYPMSKRQRISWQFDELLKAAVVYVKQQFYLLCNDYYTEFTLLCARAWGYCHFRGKINIRHLADLFFSWRSLIQLQVWHDPVWCIWPDEMAVWVARGVWIMPENWLFLFMNGGSLESVRKSYSFVKLVVTITRRHHKVNEKDILGYFQSLFRIYMFKYQ